MRRIALAIAVVAAGTAHAQEAAPPTDTGWRGQVTPYLWLTAVGGTIRPRDGLPTFDASLSRSDVLEDLDAAFFLHGTLRRDRFVLFGDAMWAALSRDAALRAPTLPVSARIRGEVTQAAGTLLAGFSVVETPAATLDLMAGFRAWRAEASVAASVNVGPFFERGASGSATKSWVDPVLGARVQWRLSPDWSVIAYADIGGFSTQSRLTWQAVGTVNTRITDTLYASVGYRHLEVDYRRGGFLLDARMSGPLLGLTYRF